MSSQPVSDVIIVVENIDVVRSTCQIGQSYLARPATPRYFSALDYMSRMPGVGYNSGSIISDTMEPSTSQPASS